MSAATTRPAAYRPLELPSLAATEYLACLLEGRAFPVTPAAPPVWAPATVAEGIGDILRGGARG